MEPFTISLIVSTVVTAGSTIHQHYQKKKAQKQADRATAEAQKAADIARKANEAQLKQFFIAVKERSNTLKLLIDKAIETGKIEDIHEYCFWTSAISELTRINNEYKEAKSIKDIVEADHVFLDNLGAYLKNELSEKKADIFSKEIINKHEYEVLEYLYDLVKSKLQTQKEEQSDLRKERLSLKTEIDSLKSREKIEGKDVSEAISFKKGRLKEIEGKLTTIPIILKKVEFLLVCLHKIVSADMEEIEEDPELKNAYNILLRYLSEKPLTDEELKFLNLFVLKYKPDIAA